MFKWLVDLFNDGRIAYSYLGYEIECKHKWVTNAELSYSTVSLEQNIKSLMSEPQRHVLSAYDAPIHDLESRKKSVCRVIAEAMEKLAMLERNYKTELDTAYEVQHEVSKALEECRQKLSCAYDDLNSAKSSLDAWYSRAEGCWFGNGGKKLPKDALFGQDLSDRNYYKSRRDSAANDVGRYKSERASIVSRLDEARSRVKLIKEDRQKMFDLKNAGFDKRIVSSAINNGNIDLRFIDVSIAQLARSREEYLHQSKVSLGVYKIEKEIERLQREKNAQIKSFDNECLEIERKAKHRAEWLAARN